MCSPNFLESFEDSIEAAFEQLNLQICQAIFKSSSTAVVSQSSARAKSVPKIEDFVKSKPIPFAKVIPQLNKVAKDKLLDCTTDSNEYLTLFVELQAAAAFYEAVFMQ